MEHMILFGWSLMMFPFHEKAAVDILSKFRLEYFFVI